VQSEPIAECDFYMQQGAIHNLSILSTGNVEMWNRTKRQHEKSRKFPALANGVLPPRLRMLDVSPPHVHKRQNVGE
jgi:hypothetical protein